MTTKKKAQRRKPTGGLAHERLPALTDRQAQVLLFIHDRCAEDSLRRSPTIKNIAVQFSIAKRTAWDFVEVLKREGCIDGEPDKARSLCMTNVGMGVVAALRAPAE